MKLQSILLLGASLPLAAFSPAQSLEDVVPPDAYIVTVTNTASGAPAVVRIYRDGSRVVVDRFDSPSATGPTAGRMRTLYNFDDHTAASWGYPFDAAGCASSAIPVEWGDPFALYGSLIGQGARVVGKERLQGMSTIIYDTPMGATGATKAWIQAGTGLVFKEQLTGPGGETRTVLEVNDVSFTPPSTATFALPPNCTVIAQDSDADAPSTTVVKMNPPAAPVIYVGYETAPARTGPAPAGPTLADIHANPKIPVVKVGSDASATQQAPAQAAAAPAPKPASPAPAQQTASAPAPPAPSPVSAASNTANAAPSPAPATPKSSPRASALAVPPMQTASAPAPAPSTTSTAANVPAPAPAVADTAAAPAQAAAATDTASKAAPESGSVIMNIASSAPFPDAAPASAKSTPAAAQKPASAPAPATAPQATEMAAASIPAPPAASAPAPAPAASAPAPVPSAAPAPTETNTAASAPAPQPDPSAATGSVAVNTDAIPGDWVTGAAHKSASAAVVPGSRDDCSVVLRVVKADTMEPITSGVQVGISAESGVESFLRSSGHTAAESSVSPQSMHEVLPSIKDGMFRIGHVPSQFTLETSFGSAGSIRTTVYLECYAPETTLLLVVKNPAHIADGAEFLWVKASQVASNPR